MTVESQAGEPLRAALQKQIVFEAFVAELRELGFSHIGLDHYLRLHNLLDRIDPAAGPDGLANLLCPIFATNKRQQSQFHRAFKRHAPLFKEAAKLIGEPEHSSRFSRVRERISRVTGTHAVPDVSAPENGDDVDPAGGGRRAAMVGFVRRHRWMVGGGVVAALIVGTLWIALVSRSNPPPAPEELPQVTVFVQRGIEDVQATTVSIPLPAFAGQPDSVRLDVSGQRDVIWRDLPPLFPPESVTVAVDVVGVNDGAPEVTRDGSTHTTEYFPAARGMDTLRIRINGVELPVTPVIEIPGRGWLAVRGPDGESLEGVATATSTLAAFASDMDRPRLHVAGPTALSVNYADCPTWSTSVQVRAQDTVFYRYDGPTDCTVASLNIVDELPTVAVDSIISLRATAVTTGGDSLAVVTWSALDDAVVEGGGGVAGRFYGVVPGVTRVVASHGSLSDTTVVVVTDAALAGGAATPPSRWTRYASAGLTIFDEHTLLTILALLVVAACIWYVWERIALGRRRIALQRSKSKQPPDVWPVTVPGTTVPYRVSEDFAAAARSLRRRQAAEAMTLAVDETIAATVKANGLPTFRYRADTRAPEYLVLIERTSVRDHHAELYADLVRTLEAHGVHVTTFYFTGDPRICFDEEGASALLVELQPRFPGHRVLVFSSGDGLLDPVTGGLADWAEEMMSWRDRAVLTPTAPSAWSMREVTLGRFAVVLPGTVRGIGAVVRHFEDADRPDLRALHYADDQPPVPSLRAAGVAERLEEYLGADAFRWLCACALYPELHWDLTLLLGGLPKLGGGLITERNLMRLIRLPWFREGAIPQDIQHDLASRLEWDVEVAVRNAIIDVLEHDRSDLPADSVAVEKRRLNLVHQRLARGRRDRKERNAQLKEAKKLPPSLVARDFVFLGLVESLPKTGFAFVVGKSRVLRRAFFERGRPLFGWRTGARFGASVAGMGMGFGLFVMPAVWGGGGGEGGRSLGTFEELAIGGVVGGVAFHPSGEEIAAVNGDSVAGIWNIANGRMSTMLSDVDDEGLAIAFSPDGGLVAAEDEDDALGFWDATTGRSLGAVGSVRDILGMAFRPDGRRIAVGNDDAQVLIVDVDGRAIIDSLQGHDGWVRSVAYSPDGTALVTASEDGARIFDAETGALRFAVSHEDEVHGAVYHPDGSVIATGGGDGTVRVWDASTSEPILTLSADTGGVLAVAISPDGALLAAGGGGRQDDFDVGVARAGHVQLWRLPDGEPVATLMGHASPIWSIAFSPDGRTFVSGSGDGTARVWDISAIADDGSRTDSLLARASALEQADTTGQNARARLDAWRDVLLVAPRYLEGRERWLAARRELEALDPFETVTLRLDPATVRLTVGDAGRIAVSGLTPAQLGGVAWRAADSGIVRVAIDGSVLGLTPGSTQVWARFGTDSISAIAIVSALGPAFVLDPDFAPGAIAATSSSDLFDVSRGTTVTASSGSRYTDAAFGAPSERAEEWHPMFFEDQRGGYAHSLEWQTASDVTLRSVAIFAGHDRQLQRAFSAFRIYSEQGQGWTLLGEYQPTIPYGGTEDRRLAVCIPVRTTTASRFRAEVVQSNQSFGPRIVEIDGYDNPACIKGDDPDPDPDPTTFRDCPTCPEMVVIPAGSFTMGSAADESGRLSNEGPQHRVTIPRFALAVSEVTRAEYRRYVDAVGAQWSAAGFPQDDGHPAVQIAWDDAKAYVAWLSRETGQPYRLASEAEWEYAARAGAETARYWGANPADACGYANVGDRSASTQPALNRGHGCDDGYEWTAPVASLVPNGFGLYDMLGNSWEWVEDCWNDSYAGAPADGSAWTAGDCAAHVLRGGSFFDIPSDVRLARRFRPLDVRNYNLGFRVAKTLAEVGDLDQAYARLLALAGSAASVRFSDPDAFVNSTYTVPGQFTASGWRTFHQTLNTSALSQQDSRSLQQRYAGDYAAQWRAYLAGAAISGFSSAGSGANVFRSLGSNQSPLLQLLVLAAEQLQVDASVVTNRSEIDQLTAEFQPLFVVVTPSQPRLVNDSNQAYILALGRLGTNIEAFEASGAATDFDAARSSIQAARIALAEIVRTFAGAGPAAEVGQTIEQLLSQPLDSAERLLNSRIAAAKNVRSRQFCASIAPILARYPFDPTATAEVSLEDFAGFFDPTAGSLFAFVDDLSGDVRLAGSRYVQDPASAVNVTTEFLDFLNRARDVTEAFYSSGPGDPQIRFTLRVNTTEDQRVDLVVDGRVESWSPTDARTIPFVMTLTNNRAALRAIVAGASVQTEFEGTWALYRLLGSASWTATRAVSQWNVTWRFGDDRATVVRANGTIVDGGLPIWAPDYFSGFQCVADMAIAQ